MSFISGTWGFLKRHKGKVAILGAAVGGYYYLNRVLNSVERNWEKSTSKDFVSEVRKKETHFENTIQTCNQTCSGLAPKIIEILNGLLNAELVLERIKSDPTNRELWKQLSITIVTRIISEVYCLCLLVCYLRVQLSVIAGYIYVDSQNGTSAVITQTIQMKYLSLLNKFYQDGIPEIIKPVQESVQHALERFKLDDKLAISDLKTIFDQVKQSMSFSLAGSNSHASRYLIKAEDIEKMADQIDDDNDTTSLAQFSNDEKRILSKMMTETQDILESDDFRRVLDSAIEIGFGLVLDQILITCFVKNSSDGLSGGDSNQFVNPSSVQVPLAKLLPSMKTVFDENRKSRTDQSENLNLVRHLLCLDILNCFAANIYEAFCEPLAPVTAGK